MILILSSQFDVSTSRVIQWLLYKGYSFVRINGENPISFVNLNINSNKNFGELLIKDIYGNIFNLKEFSSYWYRREYLDFIRPNFQFSFPEITKTLKKEWEIIENYIYFKFGILPHLGSLIKEKYHNKLISLEIAQNTGLNIADTYVLSSKKEINNLFNPQKQFITKAISNLFFLQFKKQFQSIGTKLINTNSTKILDNMSID